MHHSANRVGSSRRQFLRQSLNVVGTSAVLTGTTSPLAAVFADDSNSFSFAHLTDMHIQPELGAVDGFRQCIAKLNQLTPRPDFVITGGDLVMDALAADSERIQLEFRLFDECCRQIELPVHHVIGNHDVVGWSKQAKVKSDSPHFGKRIFADRYGQGLTYRSFDHKGWHFILLDSIGQAANSPAYIGLIDEPQIDWLKSDLAKVGKATPIVIVTHIPFFSVWNQAVLGPTAPQGANGLVTNIPQVRKILEGFNVKLVLSGHGHIRERIELGKTVYVQSGAVSGRWWKGPINGEAEAFGIVTLRNGNFSYRFEEFGWKARPTA